VVDVGPSLVLSPFLFLQAAQGLKVMLSATVTEGYILLQGGRGCFYQYQLPIV